MFYNLNFSNKTVSFTCSVHTSEKATLSTESSKFLPQCNYGVVHLVKFLPCFVNWLPSLSKILSYKHRAFLTTVKLPLKFKYIDHFKGGLVVNLFQIVARSYGIYTFSFMINIQHITLQVADFRHFVTITAVLSTLLNIVQSFLFAFIQRQKIFDKDWTGNLKKSGRIFRKRFDITKFLFSNFFWIVVSMLFQCCKIPFLRLLYKRHLIMFLIYHTVLAFTYKFLTLVYPHVYYYLRRFDPVSSFTYVRVWKTLYFWTINPFLTKVSMTIGETYVVCKQEVLWRRWESALKLKRLVWFSITNLFCKNANGKYIFATSSEFLKLESSLLV